MTVNRFNDDGQLPPDIDQIRSAMQRLGQLDTSFLDDMSDDCIREGFESDTPTNNLSPEKVNATRRRWSLATAAAVLGGSCILAVTLTSLPTSASVDTRLYAEIRVSVDELLADTISENEDAATISGQLFRILLRLQEHGSRRTTSGDKEHDLLVANAHAVLALNSCLASDFSSARSQSDTGLEILDSSTRRVPSSPEQQRSTAILKYVRGRVLFEEGRRIKSLGTKEAEEYLADAVNFYRQSLSVSPSERDALALAKMLAEWGIAKYKHSPLRGGIEELFVEAISWMEKVEPTKRDLHWRITYARVNADFGQFLFTAYGSEHAHRRYSQAIAILESQPQISTAELYLLGLLYNNDADAISVSSLLYVDEVKQRTNAIRCFKEFLQRRTTLSSRENLALAYARRAVAYLRQRQVNEAVVDVFHLQGVSDFPRTIPFQVESDVFTLCLLLTAISPHTPIAEANDNLTKAMSHIDSVVDTKKLTPYWQSRLIDDITFLASQFTDDRKPILAKAIDKLESHEVREHDFTSDNTESVRGNCSLQQ